MYAKLIFSHCVIVWHQQTMMGLGENTPVPISMQRYTVHIKSMHWLIDGWYHVVSRGQTLVCAGVLSLSVYKHQGVYTESNNAPTQTRVWPCETRHRAVSRNLCQHLNYTRKNVWVYNYTDRYIHLACCFTCSLIIAHYIWKWEELCCQVESAAYVKKIIMINWFYYTKSWTLKSKY